MSILRADAAPFTPPHEHTIVTIQLGTSCGASVVASDYSAPSSPRSSIAGSLADDRDLEKHLAPQPARSIPAQLCPELRKVGKKLAQIEQLRVKQAAGTELDKNQLAKIAKEADLRIQKSILQRDLEGKRAQALEVLGRETRPAATTKPPAASSRHLRRADIRASATRPPARSANGRAKPRMQRVSLQMYVRSVDADAAAPKHDPLSQLDQKVKAVRAAEARRQGWIHVRPRK